jgi:uracil DNA glycosylase
MSRRTSAIISTAITLIVFTVLPLYAPSLIPPEYIDMVSEFGIDIIQFANEIAMLGGVIAVLTLVKGFVQPSSVFYLLASVASSGVTLFFTIVTVSLGRFEDLANLGMTTITMEVQGALNTMSLDFRLFVWITTATVALKIVESFLKYADARKQKAVDTPHPRL